MRKYLILMKGNMQTENRNQQNTKVHNSSEKMGIYFKLYMKGKETENAE